MADRGRSLSGVAERHALSRGYGCQSQGPDPLVSLPDGSGTAPYGGPDLTVGGELNKIASNVATGRNIAGIHWRSDANESLTLGEAVAIGVLKDQRRLCVEEFDGYTFTKFDGATITV